MLLNATRISNNKNLYFEDDLPKKYKINLKMFKKFRGDFVKSSYTCSF